MEVTGPLAVTSANLHGCSPAQSATQARDYFGDKVADYVDAGKSPIGKPSTIIKVIGGDYWLLRMGAIGVDELKAVAGKVAND